MEGGGNGVVKFDVVYTFNLDAQPWLSSTQTTYVYRARIQEA